MKNLFDTIPRPETKPEQYVPSPKVRSKKREVVGLTPQELKAGTIELKELTDEAFETLRMAMNEADWPTAVVAAKLVLDRGGFGPSSTIKIDENLDLSDLTVDELRRFASRLADGKIDNNLNSDDLHAKPQIH